MVFFVLSFLFNRVGGHELCKSRLAQVQILQLVVFNFCEVHYWTEVYTLVDPLDNHVQVMIYTFVEMVLYAVQFRPSAFKPSWSGSGIFPVTLSTVITLSDQDSLM